MAESQTAPESSSTFWLDVQNETVAKRLLFEAFSVEKDGTSNWQCIVHEDGRCKNDIIAELHHLDECGKKDAHGWFFENLMPLCSSLNEVIERDPRDELVAAHKHLSRASLSELYRTYQITGRLRFAYAAARLGAFLTASASKSEDNAVETLEFASKCLLSLRGMRPRFAVPFATDTIARSVLPHIHSADIIHRRMVEALFSLVVAVGSFHREFGDTDTAFRYYRLAYPLADLAHVDWLDQRLKAFANHFRILAAGMGDDVKASQLLDLIKSKGYGKTLHEKLNILHWRDRNWPGANPSQRRERAEQFLADIAQLQRESFDLSLTPHAAFGDPTSKLKGTTILSPWDQIEILYLLADAHNLLAEGTTQDEHHMDLSKDYLRQAAKVHHDGHFAVVGLGRQKVFGDIARDYPDDPAFRFEHRYPDMLSAPLWHTQGDGPFRFNELSYTLFQRITVWLGSAPKAESSVREIKEVAG